MMKLYGQALSDHYASSTRLTAASADKYHLYQLSVQAPGADIRFQYLRYRKLRNRRPRHFREDFCGTALLTQTWLDMGSSHSAEGFDIDPEPLQWGKEHNFQPMGPAAGRATLQQADARERSLRPPDVRCALNFSYWIITERSSMLEYFTSCREDLAEHGILYLDIYGGSHATAITKDVHETDYPFSWAFEQCEYSAVTATARSRINFRFRDGSELPGAFEYIWRVWTLPEITDLLSAAGFGEVTCYRESDKEDNATLEGYRPGTFDLDAPHWVAYIAALK